MPHEPYSPQRKFPWRTAGALFFLVSAMVGFEMGVAVSERPEIVDSGFLTKAYYSLSLFVVGGVDLGTPYGGSFIGRALVWTAYFGAPILAASTLITALLRALDPQTWYLRRLRDHIILVGDGELTMSTLRALRKQGSHVPVVVVSNSGERIVADELKQNFGAMVVTGDISNAFFIEQLRAKFARRIFLLEDNSLRSYEAAAGLLERAPGIGDRVIIHCASLRFMRSMDNTAVAQRCEIFNTYHLAASGLVRSQMLPQFRDTSAKDVVILAGFGRFGQTVLEELQKSALGELDTVVIIDRDAHRRVLVADEQMEFSGAYRRELFEGDIAHPEVWERVQRTVDISGDNTVFVLGTGREEENLRMSLWLRQKYPGAMVISRTTRESLFASEVGREHNITSVSITQLVEENLPPHWLRP
ncbi:MAG: potassium transporter TrkA [Halioglobus sp.]|nr:potassium transporter TrkA [Halioglobus sp.]